MTKIAIYIYENCLYSSIIGPVDVFSVAGQRNGSPLFDVTLVSANGNTMNSFNGVPIKVDQSIDDPEQFDVIFIPAIVDASSTFIIDKKYDVKSVNRWLRTQFRGGAYLVSVCAGAFILAATGLLDGHSATTHWAFTTPFQQAFPKIQLKAENMLIEEGRLITAGGITAYYDMALHLVRLFGSAELASLCSKIFLIDSGRTMQTPYELMDHRFHHGDAIIEQAQQFIHENYKTPLSIAQLADELHLGERTFLRRFKKAAGMTPSEYVQKVRIEAAKQRLEQTRLSIDEITWEVGYTDSTAFRRLFKKQLDLTPGEYRRKFSVIRS